MSKVNTAIGGAAAGGAAGGPWGALAGGAAGYLLGSDDKSGDTLAEQLKAARDIPLPVLQKYYPELYQQVVKLNPELEKVTNLAPSAMQGIATDPALKQAQLAALGKLQQIGSAGGRDAQFMADQARLEGDSNAQLQGQEGAIMQNLAARGLSGGGSELVARNMAAQNASNKQAQMAMDLNAQAQQRALAAIQQSGQLGGQIQAQDFSQQQAKAQAADAISKFNAQNQQEVQNNNVNTQNNAQQWNAQSQQTTANNNVNLNNQAQQSNNSLSQQQYDNQMKKLGLENGAATSLANNQQQTNASNNQFLGSAISAGSTAYAANQKNKKPGDGGNSSWDY